MQQVICAAVLGIVAGGMFVGAAAPVAAQQFTFPTGDRVLQGYNVARVANDGSQAGGGTQGGTSESINSPYQSNLAGPTTVAGSTAGGGNAAQDPYSRTASVDPGVSGRVAGGQGAGGQGAGGQGGKSDSAGGGGFGGEGGAALRPAPGGQLANVGGVKGALQVDGGGGPMTLPPGGSPANNAGDAGQFGGGNVAVEGKLPGGFCPPPCVKGGNFGGTGLGLNEANAYTFGFVTGEAVLGAGGSPPTPPATAFVAVTPKVTPGPPPVTRFTNFNSINPAIGTVAKPASTPIVPNTVVTVPKQTFTTPTQTFNTPVQNLNPAVVVPKVTTPVAPTITTVVTPPVSPVVTAPVVTTQPNIVSTPQNPVITNPAVQSQTFNNSSLKSLQNLNVQRLMSVRQGN